MFDRDYPNYTQYDIDMFTKYGDWEEDDEDGLTQEDIDHAVKYGYNPFEQIMMNGYFAIQLDKQSQNVVSKNATMPVMVSDHITLAYKPVKKVYDKYSKLIGKKVGAFIKGYRSNKNIDALWIGDMYLMNDKKIKRHDKGAAHITLSHKKGYKQGDANSMFIKPDIKIKKFGYVEGKVKYFSYE